VKVLQLIQRSCQTVYWPKNIRYKDEQSGRLRIFERGGGPAPRPPGSQVRNNYMALPASSQARLGLKWRATLPHSQWPTFSKAGKNGHREGKAWQTWNLFSFQNPHRSYSARPPNFKKPVAARPGAINVRLRRPSGKDISEHFGVFWRPNRVPRQSAVVGPISV